MDQFNVLELVGEGSFGRVFKGSLKANPDTLVALKLIPKIGHSEREIKSLRSECKIQKELSHPNVVRMLDAFETVNELIAVTEFVPGGDLHKLFTLHKSARGARLQEKRIQEIAGNLISACCYLHSHRILHRDIKPQNVLITESGSAKLCDFGFARNLGIDTFVLTSIKGTPLYMAPELIEERPYDYSADLWSVGCILYELLVGIPPFSTSSLFQLIKKVRYESVDWSEAENWSVDTADFLKKLLEKDPKKRLGWPNLLKHPFLEGKLDLRGCGDESLLRLTESQELVKEIQRQDRGKSTGGSSRTLLVLAQRYEEGKKNGIPNYQRRFSEVATGPINQYQNYRRPSDLSARVLLNNARYINPIAPITNEEEESVRGDVSSIDSVIQIPSKKDEVSWIEYLNDKIKEDGINFACGSDLNKLFECSQSVTVLERLVTFLMKVFSPGLVDQDLISSLYNCVESLVDSCTEKIENEEEEDEEIEELLRVIELFFLMTHRCCLIKRDILKDSLFFQENRNTNNNRRFIVRDALQYSFIYANQKLSSTILDLCNLTLTVISAPLSQSYYDILVGDDSSFISQGLEKEPSRYSIALAFVFNLVDDNDSKTAMTQNLESIAPNESSNPILEKMLKTIRV